MPKAEVIRGAQSGLESNDGRGKYVLRPDRYRVMACLVVGMTGCASTGGGGGDNYSTITGGDHVQEVRPDIFLIISKSGFYIPDEEVPWMVVDKLMSRITGQGPAAASKRWEARANALCGEKGYRAYKLESFSYSANTGQYPRWIAGKSAYAVCNRKQYSEADIKALFPDW